VLQIVTANIDQSNDRKVKVRFHRVAGYTGSEGE